MAAYLGYTLRMKTLFHGRPVMAHETHTRRRRQKTFTLQVTMTTLHPLITITPVPNKRTKGMKSLTQAALGKKCINIFTTSNVRAKQYCIKLTVSVWSLSYSSDVTRLSYNYHKDIIYESFDRGVCVCVPMITCKLDICFRLDSYVDWRKISHKFACQGHFSEGSRSLSELFLCAQWDSISDGFISPIAGPRSVWKKFREYLSILTGKEFLLKLKCNNINTIRCHNMARVTITISFIP